MSFWRRLTWWLLAALAPVMIGHGAFVYWREQSLQVRDVTTQLDVYAHLVQRAVEQTQRARGWDEALALGQALEPRDLAFAADHRFLWVRRPDGEAPPLAEAPAELRALAENGGEQLTRRDGPDGRWRVYRLLRGSDGALGAFEVSHDAADVESFIRSTALGEAFTVLLAALACAVAVTLVNRLQVRPIVSRLIDLARRIDATPPEDEEPPAPGGRPSGPVGQSDDDIERLGAEMHRMEGRIREAHEALRHETAEKLAMAERLRHADRLALVGRLAAGVAHEFGTPLTVVRGRARLILDHPEVPDHVANSSRVVVEQVDRMSRIIRQLLDLSRRRGPPQGPCDLPQLLERMAHLLEHEAGRLRVTLVAEPSPTPVVARGDMQQLEQVALNLAMNAIQALEEKGGHVTMRCGSGRSAPAASLAADADALPVGTASSGADPLPASDVVWFEVEDDGPGITPELLAEIFEPFVTTKEAGTGTGLGLPLSAGIAQDHGGRIDISSVRERRTVFRVELPAWRPDGASAE